MGNPDEKHHEAACAKIMEKLFEIDPDGAVLAFADMMRNKITMPAQLMYDVRDEEIFDHFSVVAPRIGAYTAKDYGDILEFLLGRWKAESRTGLSAEGKEARDYICGLLPRTRKLEDQVIPKIPFSWIFNREA